MKGEALGRLMEARNNICENIRLRCIQMIMADSQNNCLRAGIMAWLTVEHLLIL